MITRARYQAPSRPRRLSEQLAARLRAHNWEHSIADGYDLAADNMRAGTKITDEHAIWHLLCEAAMVARLAFPGERRLDYPSRASGPVVEAGGSWFEAMLGYLRGDLDDAPATATRPPKPSAAQITRAELMLDLWHASALPRTSQRRRLMRALYAKASGTPTAVVIRLYGVPRQWLETCRDKASRDMLTVIRLE